MKVAVLLRAVNVGGRRLVTTDFAAALADAGCKAAQTLGAAGSAVAEAAEAGAELEGRVEAGVARRAGFASEAFARTGPELAAVLAGNPFAAFAEADPAHLAVVFLRRDPQPARVTALSARIVGREQAAGGPRCLYVCYPDGMGRSKLTAAAIERGLGEGDWRGTARNWNTVRRLAELTRGA